jgi:hypothetical protein
MDRWEKDTTITFQFGDKGLGWCWVLELKVPTEKQIPPQACLNSDEDNKPCQVSGQTYNTPKPSAAVSVRYCTIDTIDEEEDAVPDGLLNQENAGEGSSRRHQTS